MKGLQSLLLIKEGEGRQIAFYLLLFICLGAGMAIGKGSADAMFLKRYGIEYLPIMYLFLSVVLGISYTVYAAYVDRVPPEKLFFILLIIQIILLTVFWGFIVLTDNDTIYPAYYLVYELASELIIVHGLFYVGQNMDTLQSKRLMPLILAGYQTGMIIGGFILALVIPGIGVENAIIVWSALVVISAVLLYAWHKKNGASPYYISPPRSREKASTRAKKELTRGLHFIKKSQLLKSASLALFFLVIMFYVLIFSVNKIYSEHMRTEEELAAFFGFLVAITNMTALFLQIFISSRVIEKFGVSKTKLIFPITSIISFMMLLISPGFYAALVASFNKDSIMPAFRNPVRQMFFNVLPDYMRGRARATSTALVLPVALFICGILIWYLQSAADQFYVIYLGLFCAVMYLFFSYRMGKGYVVALINSLKEKLYLPDNANEANYYGGNPDVYEALLEGLNNSDGKVSLSYAKLLIKAYQKKSIEVILSRLGEADAGVADQMIKLIGEVINEEQFEQLLQHIDSVDDHCQATIYDIIFTKSRKDRKQLISDALNHANQRVIAAGIRGAFVREETVHYKDALHAWKNMIEGAVEHTRSAIELIPLLQFKNLEHKDEFVTQYANIMSNVLKQSDEKHRAAMYGHIKYWQWDLPEDVKETICRDLDSLSPELRSAASSCLYLLSNEPQRQAFLWKALGDGHINVRKSAIKTLNLHLKDPAGVYYEWLLINKAGSSRAQLMVLQEVIKKGLPVKKLKKIIDAKARYASDLLSVLHRLGDIKNDDAPSLYIMKQALGERLMQTLNLALMALEPVIDRDIIAVIRAGINSKDKRQQANAQEALQSIEGDTVINVLSGVIDKDYSRTRKRGLGRSFADIGDALIWCKNGNDNWLSECGSRVLQDMKLEGIKV